MKQLSLFTISKSFGGELLVNARKNYRPISSQKPVHLVLRSDVVLEFGGFKKHEYLVGDLIYKFSEKYSLKIFRLAVCSNHLHMVLRYEDKLAFQNFLRALTGRMALAIRTEKAEKPFWLHRPFTRVLEWGRDFERTLNYVEQNILEADGYIEHQHRR